MICCLCPLIAPPPSGPDCRTPGPWGPLPAVSWEKLGRDSLASLDKVIGKTG